MKKLFNLALATFMFVASVASTSLTASALETGSITISNTPAETGLSIMDKTFNAYRIFDVVKGDTDQSVDANQTTINEDFVNFFANAGIAGYAEMDDQAKVNAALAYVNSFSSKMIELTTKLAAYISGNIDAHYTLSGATEVNGVQTVSTEVSHGYYLVIDQFTNPETADNIAVAVARMVDTVTGDLTITVKGSLPTIEKFIKDNDPDASPEWTDVADNQIGDNVEFKLVGKLPTDITDYKDYSYVMTDTLSAGLSLNFDTIKIYTNADLSTALDTTYYTLTKTDTGFTIDYAINEMFAAKVNPAYVYVTYSAELTKDAVIATDPNTNTVTLDYSNNPYDEKDKGTASDKVYDYTFKLDVAKVDGENKPLANAVFGLFIGEKQLELIDLGNNVYAIGTGEGTTITTDSTGLFSIVGLDDKVTYTLKEIDAPSGYNEIKDMDFTINATYKGTAVGTITSNFDVTDNGVEVTVVNTKNLLLPETGGMGTVIFYGAGAAIMVGAAFLFMKSRKED